MKLKFSHLTMACVTVICLYGCDSDGNPVQEPIEESEFDSTIDDVPVMADAFVMSLFYQSADSDPVDIEEVELVN